MILNFTIEKNQTNVSRSIIRLDSSASNLIL